MTCCDKYNSGMLRTTVAFERKTRTPDGAGGFTDAWGSLSGSQTRGMVRALNGGERWAAMRVEAKATHRVVVRYFSGLLESDSIVIAGRRHNIRFINNVDFEDRWYEITTELGAAV